jgi:hypothetical protein
MKRTICLAPICSAPVYSAIVYSALVAAVAMWSAPTYAAGFDWRSELLTAERVLSAPGGLTPGNCARSIDSVTSRLAALPSAAFAPADEREAARIADEGDRWLARFFNLRVLIKKRLDSFAAPSQSCVDAVRRAFRFSRFAEDYLAQWLVERGALDGAAKPLLSGPAPHLLVNSAAGGADLQSGDVLLVRGPLFISGLVARSADEQGDFSHLAMVARDETGRKFIVESLIETGAHAVPLDEYLQRRDEWRAVVLRHQNASVADRAGAEIYAKVRASLDAGKPIPYNFTLDMSDETRLFCAQVARSAYLAATDGRISAPRYPSSLTRFRETAIGRAMHVTVGATFAPSDLQFDPRFRIVAEFRNPALIPATRHGAVAVARLMVWMTSGYTFGPNFLSEIGARIAIALAGPLGEAGGLDYDVAAVLLKASKVYDILTARADAIDAQAIAETGRPLTFRELEASLEDFRLADCEANAAGGASALHAILIAPPSGCALRTADRAPASRRGVDRKNAHLRPPALERVAQHDR